MSLLSDDDIADIRSVMNQTKDDLATVKRRVRVSDGAGGHTITYTTPYTNVPCSVGPVVSGCEIVEVAEQSVLEFTPWAITFEAGVVILADDRILIGTRTFEARSV